MRIPRPRAGARTGRVAVGILLLGAILLALPTSPATGDPEDEPQGASQSNLVPAPPGVAPLIADDPGEGFPGYTDLPLNKSISATEGTVTNSQRSVVLRSKMSITTSPIWAALYLYAFNEPVENPTAYKPACAGTGHCTPDPFYQPDCATDDLATQWMTAYSRHPLYPLKPLKGGGAEVGVLTETKVHLIAFGTIPATATLTMSVPRVDGKVQPLMSHMWDRKAKGCAPLPPDLPKVSALVEGKVIIQLSDLQIDGVPVDLGPKCRTGRPADVYLWNDPASGAYFPSSGGPLGAFEGLHPGSRGPLNDPYYFEDKGRTLPASSGVDIPPFVNCGARGDDLSKLVSAMASGPNNPVRAVQGSLIFLDRIPLEDLDMCATTDKRCPLPPPATPPMPPLTDGEGQ